MKNKRKNGISLIVLVITIIVVIILASSVIINIAKNNVFNDAKKAEFLSNIRTFKDELDLYILNKSVNSISGYDKNTLQANKIKVTENSVEDTTRNITDIIASIKGTKYESKIEVKNGVLVYVGQDEKEIEWAETIIKVEGTTSSSQKYTISFDANGGINAPAAQSKEHDNSFNITTDVPSRDDYTFIGWATSADGEVQYMPGSAYEHNSDITLYAKWIVTVTSFEYAEDNQVQEFIAPITGKYKLEVWGAEGGYNSSASSGGNGGYSVGTINLEKGEKLYVYVGASGKNGGFNGGGTSEKYTGGGATDIRVEQDSLYARVIVAGGGGAQGGTAGAYGGGITGGTVSFSYGVGGNGATQTSAGGSSSTVKGEFGVGGKGTKYYMSSSYWYGGGGGGGWYGGAGASAGGGGGGSGYVYTSDTAANYPTGCLLNSEYYLEDATTIAGNSAIPTTDGTSTMTGNEGNGYAKITILE